MNKKKRLFLISILILILFALNYSWLNGLVVKTFEVTDSVFVERVIDGDTIVVRHSSGENETVRMLGINTPEKNEKYYSEAKDFLSGLILNETVQLKNGRDKYDLYNRRLAFVYFRGENVNLKLVEGGFANAYFPSGKEFGYFDFAKAWENCISTGENLCEPSEDVCSECIEISSIDFESEVLTLKNSCNFECSLSGWEIKDEGRKKFDVNVKLKRNSQIEVLVSDPDSNNLKNSTTLIWERKDYVWTDSGDTGFLRDSRGKIVDYFSY